jgi:putative transposase
MMASRCCPRLAKRLKGLESENARLKKLLADAMLDNAALKDLLAKKW